jgi:hypothetical protein
MGAAFTTVTINPVPSEATLTKSVTQAVVTFQVVVTNTSAADEPTLTDLQTISSATSPI